MLANACRDNGVALRHFVQCFDRLLLRDVTRFVVGKGVIRFPLIDFVKPIFQIRLLEASCLGQMIEASQRPFDI